MTYDPLLLLPVLLLVGFGLVMIYSASSALALKSYGNDLYFLKKQLIAAAIGAIALFSLSLMPHHWLRGCCYPALAAAVIALLAVKFSPWGHQAGGAMRWLRFGPLSFQPTEPARLALVLFLAYSLSKKQDCIDQFSIGMLPHAAVFGLLAALIAIQPDFGSVVLLAVITWLMMFAGGVPLRHLASPMVVVAPLGYLYMIGADYRLERLISFRNPWQYASDSGYQIVHSLMAFGSGGIWGSGVGNSYQKLFYLPEPHTDFIFSVIGEETGLLGVLAILALYLLIFWRGLVIARQTPDAFGSMLAVGLTTSLILQVCVNMGVALGLLPTKGLTLPFLSYGGTSLIFSMAAVGVLLSISARRRPATTQEPAQSRRAIRRIVKKRHQSQNKIPASNRLREKRP